MNSKLHAVCNGAGKPVALLLSEGQVSDYKGAAQLLDSLPPAKELLADRGYDAAWRRNALLEKGIALVFLQERIEKSAGTRQRTL